MENVNASFDLECFFHLSPHWLCVAGFDGYFKKVNPAVIKTLGYAESELLARPIDSFVYIEDRSRTVMSRESVKKNNPLLDFENRYVTKKGDIVWLSWTSMPVKSQRLVFAIARNITHKKKLEERIRESYKLRSGADQKILLAEYNELLKAVDDFPLNSKDANEPVGILSISDQLWLYELETLVRKYIGKIDLSIVLLSSDLGISERQLHRRIKSTTGVTPNIYIRRIRLRMSMEAINSGKYRTVAEISYIAGFETPAYFRKLFKEFYGRDVAELLQ